MRRANRDRSSRAIRAPTVGAGPGKLRCVEIVAARPADGEGLHDLHVATWAVTYRGRVPDAWYCKQLAIHRVRDWADVVRRQRALGGGVLAARCDGRIAGLCQYGPTEDDDDDPRRVGHIHRLYVDPARQRTGVGRALLTTSTDRLRQMGVSAATLWVLETDDRARAFYESLGWEADGERKSHPVADLRYRLPLV
jgi:ribosomal protein S18 acetylase RimI-like enzyme